MGFDSSVRRAHGCEWSPFPSSMNLDDSRSAVVLAGAVYPVGIAQTTHCSAEPNGRQRTSPFGSAGAKRMLWSLGARDLRATQWKIVDFTCATSSRSIAHLCYCIEELRTTLLLTRRASTTIALLIYELCCATSSNSVAQSCAALSDSFVCVCATSSRNMPSQIRRPPRPTCPRIARGKSVG